MLYTIAFGLLGLHEAAAATGDSEIRRAEDRLAEFVVRVQVESETHPYLDGAWLRAFDFDTWEYWGSSADEGWGAWCVETGWCNAWLNAVLSLRRSGRSLWEHVVDGDLSSRAAEINGEMLEKS